MIYEQIHAGGNQEASVAEQCRVLGVSRSGYYDWCERPVSARDRENARLLEKIRVVHTESEQTYGSPRVHTELQEQGERCGKNRIARLMRENKVVSIHRRKYRTTTDSSHCLPVVENILAREFEASAPDQKWVGDITYLRTREGWLYLAVVMDLFSRQIIGWSMSESLSKDLAVDALDMALKQRGVGPELFHSDRGVQYASGRYQGMLERQGTIPSMSRRGNCWDNAVAESFFKTLKVERVYRRAYVTRAHARRDVFDYIERFYNRKRRHSSIGNINPVAFEKQYRSAA